MASSKKAGSDPNVVPPEGDVKNTDPMADGRSPERWPDLQCRRGGFARSFFFGIDSAESMH
jgi:hypothetical protein